MRRGEKHLQSNRLGMRRKTATVIALSMVMSGFQGMSLPTLAEEQENHAIQGGESRIVLNLDGSSLRAAAEAAVQEGSSLSLGGSVLGNQSQKAAYESYFDGSHRLYELSLDSVDASLSSALSQRDTGLRIFVEPVPVSHAALYTDDSTVGIYEGNGELAELLSGGDIYQDSAELSFESEGEAEYSLDGRAVFSFLYENQSEETKTFVLRVDEEKIDTVKVKPAKRLFGEVKKETEKNLLGIVAEITGAESTVAESIAATNVVTEVIEPAQVEAPEGQGAQEAAQEMPAEPAEALENAAAGAVEESNATEAETTAEPGQESAPAENIDGNEAAGIEAKAIEENAESPEAGNETAEAAPAERPEAEIEAEEEDTGLLSEISSELLSFSRSSAKRLGRLLHSAGQKLLSLGSVEAKAAEREENLASPSEITESVEAAPAESAAIEQEEPTAAAQVDAGEGKAEETAAAETQPALDMGDSEERLEALRDRDLRELMDAVVMQQYRASKLLRNVETERKITVRYQAQLGGTVSRKEETVDVLAEDAALEGSTAEVNEKYYSFGGWENAAGDIVSEEETLLPEIEELKSDTSFTARFVRNVEMPAFKTTWAGDGIIVTVEAPEGTFPAGTELKAKEVGEDEALAIVQEAVGTEQTISRAVAVDLSFRYEGEEIQPENVNNVRVSMTLSGERRMEDAVVAHKHEGEAAEELPEAEEVSRNSRTQTIAFEAEKFSIYAIGETAKLVSYRFYDAEGKELSASYTDKDGNPITVSEQKVKKGDRVYAPGAPEKENAVFLGWSTEQNKTALGEQTEALDSDRAPFESFELTQDVENSVTINYYPVFAEKYYVFFKEAKGDNTRTIATLEGVKGDEIILMEDKGGYRVSTVRDVPLESTQSIVGWRNAANDELVTENANSIRLENQDTTLYPEIGEGHYVNFKTGEGGSYIEPEFVAAGGRIVKPQDPTRAGYRFTGWLREEGNPNAAFQSFNQVYNWGTEETLTLYAGWEASDAPYRVYIWKQKVSDAKTPEDSSDNHYDFVEALSRTAKTGTEVSANTTEFRDYIGTRYKSGFRFSAKNAESKEIVKGDGTTVLNVYYDRQLMMIEFNYTTEFEYVYQFTARRRIRYLWGSPYNVYIRTDTGTEVPNPNNYIKEPVEGNENLFDFYSRERKKVTYTGLYGSYFSDPVNNYTWPGERLWEYTTGNSGTITLTVLDEFNFDELSLAGGATILNLWEKVAGNVTIYHYRQEEESRPQDHDKNAASNVRVSANAGSYFPNNKFGNGYDLVYYKKNNSDWIKMEHHTNSNGEVIYTGSGISNNRISMNARDTLYFWYKRKSFSLTFDNRIPAGEPGHLDTLPVKTIQYKDRIQDGLGTLGAPDPGTREGYTFGGWVVDTTENAEVFNFDQEMPANNLIAYAKWIPLTYHVYVHDMDKKEVVVDLGEFPRDSTVNQNAMPKVQSGDAIIFDSASTETLEVPAEMFWSGWVVKDGDSYKPYNFDSKIREDVHIYARYVNTKPYQLLYDMTASVAERSELANKEELETAFPAPIEDDMKYGLGSTAKLKGSELLEVSEEKLLPRLKRYENGGEEAAGEKTMAFLGWSTRKDAETPSYFPNDSIEISGNMLQEDKIVLYAIYGEPEELVAVEYRSNYPDTGDDKQKSYSISAKPNNEKLTALSTEATGITGDSADASVKAILQNYDFKGWTATQYEAGALPEGNKELIKVETSFHIDKAQVGEDGKSLPNVLYAYWCPKPTVKLTIKNTVTGNMSNKTDTFTFTMSLKKGDEPYNDVKLGITGGEITWTMNGKEPDATIGKLFEKLPKDISISITVVDAQGRHYTTTAESDNTEASPDFSQLGMDGGGVSAFRLSRDTVLTFTHRLDEVTPTGIVKDNLPFILMLLLAAGMGGYFLLGRKREEED